MSRRWLMRITLVLTAALVLAATIGYADANVTVNIDLNDTKPIGLMYGYNNIFANIKYQFNEATMKAACIESGANLMRFPAGTLGDFYDFQHDDFFDDVLHNPAKYGVSHPNWSNYAQGWINYINSSRANRGVNHYGFAEFRNLIGAANMNAYPVYMGNISTGPYDASSPYGCKPVDYLKASMQILKNQGISVPYLELGNELTTYDLQKLCNGFDDQNRIITESERAANLIRPIFGAGNIQFGAFGGWSGARDTGTGNNRDSWNRKLAQYSPKSWYDAVTMHTYLRMVTSGKTNEQILRTMMANTQLLTANSYDHWKALFPGKKIWMTETGITTDAAGGASPLATSVLHTLVEVDYLLRWLDYDDVVTMYNKHTTVTQELNDNTVLFYKYADQHTPELIKTPLFHGYSLAFSALKKSNTNLRTTTANDVTFLQAPADTGNMRIDGYWDINGDLVVKQYGNGAGQMAVPELTARSVLSTDGTKINVIYVNKSVYDKNIVLNLIGRDLTGKPVTLKYVTGALADRNDRNNPNRITVTTNNSYTAGQVITLPGYSTGTIEFSVPSAAPTATPTATPTPTPTPTPTSTATPTPTATPTSTPSATLPPGVVNLASYYNQDGFSYDTNRTDGAYEVASPNSCYAAELVNSNPTFEGIAYVLGPKADGANNEVKCTGQTVALPQGEYASIRFLASATNAGPSGGQLTGTFRINYTDSTYTNVNVTVKGWCATSVTGEKIVQTMAHKHLGDTDQVIENRIYAYYLTPAGGKTVSSLGLPNNPDIHVLAISVVAATPTPNPTSTPTPTPVMVDLSASYNQDGFSYDTNRTDGAYEVAATNSCYAAELINSNPTFEGASYSLGPKTDGANNVVKGTGQTISLPQGRYSSVRFLASATNAGGSGGQLTGTFRVNYSDGTYTDGNVTVKGWCATNTSGQKIVQTMAHKHLGDADQTINNYVFAYYLTPTADKTVTGLRLPNNADIHVLAITLMP